LVEEDDDLLAVVGVEVDREVEERSLVERMLGGTVRDGAVALDLRLAEPVAVEQVAMLVEEARDLEPEGRERVVEALVLGLVERKMDDRVPLKVRKTRALCYRAALASNPSSTSTSRRCTSALRGPFAILLPSCSLT